jgi:Leucine-rich repeat (LRR) protein
MITPNDQPSQTKVESIAGIPICAVAPDATFEQLQDAVREALERPKEHVVVITRSPKKIMLGFVDDRSRLIAQCGHHPFAATWSMDRPVSEWEHCVFECDALTILNISQENVQGTLNVSGCPALQTLYCHNSGIVKLDVSGCPGLKWIDCFNNDIVKLDVSDCPTLQILCCSHNILTELDVSDHPLLQRFYCDDNNLTELDVSDHPLLQRFYCDDNNLTELDVSGCTALQEIYCSWDPNVVVKK